jgi:penicillin-binding protein 2
VVDYDEFQTKSKSGLPFAIEVTSESFTSQDVYTFNIPQRYTENQTAQHLIGYISEGVGVSGLEKSYSGYLDSLKQEYSITFTKDGLGQVLQGIEPTISTTDTVIGGIVTTLDSTIQSICEEAMSSVEMGACLVTEVSTGEIKAMVSVPSYDVYNLEDSLNAESSPFLNRTLCEYSCGSIFKLVTSGVALECGISSNYQYECTGSIDINGQEFNCHKLDGHGVQDMQSAIKNSCNTYFIDLAQNIPSDTWLDICGRLGFGHETILAKNVTSSEGHLPTLLNLEIPAEKGNFSFGQGLLTVTPIQINSLTCAIANDGDMPILYVVKGKTTDGKSLYDVNSPKYTPILSTNTARLLQRYMWSAVQGNPESNGRPSNTTASGKTSTAQTGQYHADGTEICQAWITGYFPSDKPKYAVTVLVEDGTSGNTTASPIFKQIVENIVTIM